MEIDVYLMDDNCIPIEMDSATTASEVCAKICEELDLRDRVGFSLFISIFGKVISMEAGGCHIMDSICQCEDLVKSKGVDEADIPWRIEFRKEMFTPWQTHEHFLDPVANDLVFHQIMKFVRSGQYKCSKVMT
jgi:myosin-7